MKPRRISLILSLTTVLIILSEALVTKKQSRLYAQVQTVPPSNPGRPEPQVISIQSLPLNIQGILQEGDAISSTSPSYSSSSPNYRDEFIFDGQAGQKIAVQFNGSADDLALELYDNEGKKLIPFEQISRLEYVLIDLNNYDGTTIETSSLFLFLLPYDDVYKIVVKDNNSNANTLSYSFSLKNADIYEPLARVNREINSYLYPQVSESISSSDVDYIQQTIGSILTVR